MSDVERTVMFQLPTVIAGKLVCIEGSVAGTTHELSAGTFMIGRKVGSDLYLPNEQGVSKLHAKILAEGDSYVIVDAESRNGTVVNGSPVQRHVLRDGDEIRICSCVLRFSQSGDIDVRNPVDAYESQQPTAEASVVAPAVAAPASSIGDHKSDALMNADVAPIQPPAKPIKSKGLVAPFITGFMVFLLFGAAAMAAVVALSDESVDDASSGENSGALASNLKTVENVEGKDTKQGEGDAPAEEGVVKEPTQDTDKARALAEASKNNTDDGAKVDEAKVDEAKGDEAKSDPAKADPAKAAAEAASNTQTVAVTKLAPKNRKVGARSSGRVQSIAVAVGDVVKKGQTLFVTEESANPAAIATLRESIKALEAVVESQPSAEEFLVQEKAKLRALQNKTRPVKTSAPLAGEVLAVNTKRGARVSSRSAVIEIAPSAGGTYQALFEGSVKKGQALTLQSDTNANIASRVLSVVREGNKSRVTLDVSKAGGENITRATLKK